MFILIFLCVGITYSGIIHVPAQQPTIQAGINAAADGDVVLVAEGTYFENINFLGKKITLASHFYLDQQKIHIKKTIIDGSKATDPAFGSVVSFISGEDTNSVLYGFSITGGSGTITEFPGLPPICQGGGILCSFSGARIIHNRIINNKAGNSRWGIGGGLSTGPPFFPAYIIVEENEFIGNEASGPGQALGGGASFCSSGKVLNNLFEKNLAYSLTNASGGGGLDVQSWDPAEPPLHEVIISGNIIIHNKALQGEDATFWLGGIGGGLDILYSKAVITNNVIQHNEVSAASVSSAFGAGVLFDFPSDETFFKNNIVSHNTFSGSGACYGGGFAIWDGNPVLENNLFENNKATMGGGGWIGDAFSSARFINNTFTKNQAEMGGALYGKNATPIVMNSILWNNHAFQGSEIYLESGDISVSYCDVSGGWPGKGNADMNPLFMKDICLLNANSPCIDAGCGEEMYNDPENPIIPGLAIFPSRGMVCNDMGAYGGPGAAGWRDIKNDGVPFAAEPILARAIKTKCFPNPFNPVTTIEYQIPELSYVNLAIYNMLGQKVVNLISERQSEGNYQITWDAAGCAGGVYFYRLTTNQGFDQTRKLIFLK